MNQSVTFSDCLCGPSGIVATWRQAWTKMCVALKNRTCDLFCWLSHCVEEWGSTRTLLHWTLWKMNGHMAQSSAMKELIPRWWNDCFNSGPIQMRTMREPWLWLGCTCARRQTGILTWRLISGSAWDEFLCLINGSVHLCYLHKTMDSAEHYQEGIWERHALSVASNQCCTSRDASLVSMIPIATMFWITSLSIAITASLPSWKLFTFNISTFEKRWSNVQDTFEIAARSFTVR